MKLLETVQVFKVFLEIIDILNNRIYAKAYVFDYMIIYTKLAAMGFLE